MTSKQEKLDNISRLKSELKAAQEQFNKDYVFYESEIKIIDFLKKNKGGATSSNLSQNIRAFARVEKDSREQLLENMVDSGIIECRNIPTPSGRGRPCTKYFLVAADD